MSGREWGSRLGRSTEELASEERQRRSESVGADRLGTCRDRQNVRLRGTIEVLTVRPRRSSPWLEAEFTDGTGSLRLIWMGRREIPGIEAGRELIVEGRVSDADGERTIYNPRYQLI